MLLLNSFCSALSVSKGVPACPCAVLQQKTVLLSTNVSLAAALMTHQTAGSSAGSAFTWFAVMIPA